MHSFLLKKTGVGGIPRREELIKSRIFDDSDAAVQIIVFRKFERLKRTAQRETPNLPVKVFFLLLLLLVSFYFILKAEVCSYLLHCRKFQI